MDQYNNVRIKPEYVGITGLLFPFLIHNAGVRVDMAAAHMAQWRIIQGAEFPNIYTGYEQRFKDYTYDSTARTNDVKVLKVIPKYGLHLGRIQLGDNPMDTVIYRDMVTGEVGYFNIKRFTNMTKEFGHENRIQPGKFQPGALIHKDEPLYDSPAIKDDLYCMGVNANVAFMSTVETTEDALIISESLANKLSPTSITNLSISMGQPDKYPLNLYGHGDDYKIIPDLGDKVNPNGIVAAFRRTSDFSGLSDLSHDKLRKVNHLSDEPFYTLAGGTVVDIDVHLSKNAKLPPIVYDQVIEYHKFSIKYYQAIYDAYMEYKTLPITEKFGTLVTEAMGRLLMADKPVKGFNTSSYKLTHKGKEVTLKIELTIAKQVPINLGFKSTDRGGSKGVIGTIRPDDEIGIDEQGFQIDAIIDPVSVMKRTNASQIHETYIGRVAKWISMNLDKLPNVESRYEEILGFIGLINSQQADLIRSSLSKGQIADYVESCQQDTIQLHIPPALDSIGSKLIDTLVSKYKTPISRVTFVTTSRDGVKRPVTTAEPVCIGPKYIYLLNKFPKPLAPGYGYINKLHLPIKSKRKLCSPVGNTPCRFGEAENRMFIAAGCGDVAVRLACLLGNSSKGPSLVINTLLDNKYPSRLKRFDITIDQLQASNYSIHAANNMFRAVGVEAQKVLIGAREANVQYNKLNKLMASIADDKKK